MDWQLPLVMFFIAAATYYIGRETVRSVRGTGSKCQGGCACGRRSALEQTEGTRVNLISIEQLTARLPQSPRV